MNDDSIPGVILVIKSASLDPDVGANLTLSVKIRSVRNVGVRTHSAASDSAEINRRDDTAENSSRNNNAL